MRMMWIAGISLAAGMIARLVTPSIKEPFGYGIAQVARQGQ
ncbi:hypothetical protein AAII07_50230 [Microvirga sp. 0TCS3.31]